MKPTIIHPYENRPITASSELSNKDIAQIMITDIPLIRGEYGAAVIFTKTYSNNRQNGIGVMAIPIDKNRGIPTYKFLQQLDEEFLPETIHAWMHVTAKGSASTKQLEKEIMLADEQFGSRIDLNTITRQQGLYTAEIDVQKGGYRFRQN